MMINKKVKKNLHNKINSLVKLSHVIRKGSKGPDVWPSMVSHTWNLCSAFNPSKYTPGPVPEGGFTPPTDIPVLPLWTEEDGRTLV